MKGLKNTFKVLETLAANSGLSQLAVTYKLGAVCLAGFSSAYNFYAPNCKFQGCVNL